MSALPTQPDGLARDIRGNDVGCILVESRGQRRADAHELEIGQPVQVLRELLAEPECGAAVVQRADELAERIDEELKRVFAAKAQALRYGNEIASDYTYTAIRFLEVVLSWFWNKIYDGIKVNNIEGVQKVAQEIGRAHV